MSIKEKILLPMKRWMELNLFQRLVLILLCCNIALSITTIFTARKAIDEANDAYYAASEASDYASSAASSASEAVSIAEDIERSLRY